MENGLYKRKKAQRWKEEKLLKNRIVSLSKGSEVFCISIDGVELCRCYDENAAKWLLNMIQAKVFDEDRFAERIQKALTNAKNSRQI